MICKEGIQLKKIFSLILAAVVILSVSSYGFAAQELVPLEFVKLVARNNAAGTAAVSTQGMIVFTEESEMFVDVEYNLAGSTNYSWPQYDSRDYNCITSVKNQGSTGGCWSFCTMSALESDSIKKGYVSFGEADFSESHLVWFALNPVVSDVNSPFYGDGTNISNPYFYGGNWLIAASALSRWNGVAPDSDFPYYPNDVSLMGNYDESDRYNTETGVVLDSVEVLPDTASIKSWIVEHGSVMALCYFDNSCLNLCNGEYAYYYGGENDINHAITIVGWDDSFSATNFKQGSQPASHGAWLVKNSWGSNYANNGYFWISYEDAALSDFAGYTAQKADNYRTNYSYNGTYWESAVSHNGVAQIASVFETKEYEKLAAVSTYTLQPSTDLTVYVYTNAVSGPVSGTLSYTYSTKINNSGYHTVHLPEEIEMEPGTKFSIVLELSHPSGVVYLPIENTSSSTAYSCKAGQSYLNLPAYNIGWYDVQDYKVQNTFIQAFTRCSHQFEEITIDPTCTDKGHLDNVCSQCAHTELLEYYDATGHEFGEWSPFVSQDGSRVRISTRECEICGFEENRRSIEGNVFTLTDFFEMLLDLFIQAFENLFN